jgi:hypothetical protein
MPLTTGGGVIEQYKSQTQTRLVMGRNDYSKEDSYRATAETALRQRRAEFKAQGASIDTCYRVGVPW